MSDDASRRRREALEALRQKKSGSSVPPQPRSPSADSEILVPASSSPARTPQGPASSKYFAASRPASGAGQKLTDGDSSRGAMQSAFPGKRAEMAAAAAEKRQSPALSGSPQDVLRAIRPQAPSVTASSSSSSVAAASGATRKPPPVINLADSSPDTPRPRQRLKKRYHDPDEDSPVKPTSAAGAGAGSASSGASRTPSLLLAAEADYKEGEERMVKRLVEQFPLVRRSVVVQLLRKNPGNPDLAINQIQHLNNLEEKSSYTAPSVVAPKPVPARAPAPAPAPVKAKPAPKPVSPAKPKHNETSTIYDNRTAGKRQTRARSPEAEVFSDSGSSDDEARIKRRRTSEERDAAEATIKAFNEESAEMISGTIACTEAQVKIIIKHRPYEDEDDVYRKLTKARGVSYKLFEQYQDIIKGFVQIDQCLNNCDTIAQDVARTLAVWRGASHIAEGSVVGTPKADSLNDVNVDVEKVSELLKSETDLKRRAILRSYIQTQPALLSEGTVLKDYQLLGVNWLNLLWSKKIGCILADEMGLGKTIQVIAFIASLKERGITGPHMIFVPASTLENWTREFKRFAPDIDVQTYYGSQSERAALRSDLKQQYKDGQLEVVLASYTQVTAPDDLGFFRKKIEFETCIYDEGHRLKSCTTKAYKDLLSIHPKWRLLLTGTPLQNNLQELVSLLMFIHKDTFEAAEPFLRALFKSQGSANLLSQSRTGRARTMLTPFVLRRRKAHVLSLPPKVEMVEYCEMTPVQGKLYAETMQKSKKVLEEMSDEALAEAADDEAGEKKPAAKKNAKAKKPTGLANSSSNILMDLRKAASHPLLFRRLYTDAKIKQLAKVCLNTPTYCDCNLDYVIEDFEYMSDYEISRFCTESVEDELRKYALDPEVFLEGGKITALIKHIDRCKAEGKRMLLFSQFVMILDILEQALDHLGIRFTRLDGQTKTDERQGLVDEFNEDQDITVFLLSTKAGGVGINLTAASVVVIYDQDFNPHNDRQAADRAYRIGQDREVEVIKLITKGSIDEDMFEIGQTKLQLDDMVGGEEVTLDGTNGADDQTAKETKKSLLTHLRSKFKE
ncbi:hypothetical protein IAT38_000858 [Cryptococcus sp. DSM 104549]